VLFFFAFYYGGVIEHAPPDQRGTVVEVIPDRPAEEAGLQDGDTIVEVAGTKVSKWKEMSEIISKNPAKPITIVVLRRPESKTKGDGEAEGETEAESEAEGERISMQVTPQDKDGKGLIGVMLKGKRRPVDAAEAAKLAVTKPPVVVENLVVGLGQWITGKVEAELGGPVKIVEVSARAMRRSPWEYLALLGALSAYLGAFNLIPFPALDGGRLMFLGYELATRRKPNAKIEAHIHVVGLMMLLGLMLYVTIFNDFNLGGSK
jgi:regulator of sigma E protease